MESEYFIKLEPISAGDGSTVYVDSGRNSLGISESSVKGQPECTLVQLAEKAGFELVSELGVGAFLYFVRNDSF